MHTQFSQKKTRFAKVQTTVFKYAARVIGTRESTIADRRYNVRFSATEPILADEARSRIIRANPVRKQVARLAEQGIICDGFTRDGRRR